jgi:hypothetical protein
LTVEGNSDLLLIGTHSSWIGATDIECKQHYRKITDFPEAWEACEISHTLELPPGEYCGTTNGLYRRKEGGAR